MMKTQIFDYIKNNPTATFVEISRNVEGFEGDLELNTTGNVVLWSRLTKPAIDGILELVRENKITPIPSSVFVYAYDGGVLSYPLAKLGRTYKRPHWLPVVFSVTKQ